MINILAENVNLNGLAAMIEGLGAGAGHLASRCVLEWPPPGLTWGRSHLY